MFQLFLLLFLCLDDYFFVRFYLLFVLCLCSFLFNGGCGCCSGLVNNNFGFKKVWLCFVKNRLQLNGDSYGESFNGYSSGDGVLGLLLSKSKDYFGNMEISVDNIVEGGCCKCFKFDSLVC